MNIGVISFTENGSELALRVKEALEREGIAAVHPVRGEAPDAWVQAQFAAGRPMIFIGACGIAVRMIAPYVKSKLTDSPVLVMDEKGCYVIPILSGHVGGANELAERIAACMGAMPVITTATDLNGCFAVDLFAKENQLQILKKEGIAAVSGKLLAGETVTVSVQGMAQADLPEGLVPCAYPPPEPVDLMVSEDEGELGRAACPLRPKTYAVGLGCRKGKGEAELEAFFLAQLGGLGLTPGEVFAIASVDQKSGEEGLSRLAEKYRIPFVTFSAEELQAVEGTFHASAFVREQVGVDNVCERAACRACGETGRMVLEKQSGDGMTLAVARRSWRAADLMW